MRIEQNKTLAHKMMCALSSGQQTFSHAINYLCAVSSSFLSFFPASIDGCVPLSNITCAFCGETLKKQIQKQTHLKIEAAEDLKCARYENAISLNDFRRM